jgi:hypothetical protein
VPDTRSRRAAWALVLATACVALAATPPLAGAANGTLRFSLVSVTTSDTFVDKPPKGASAGDVETSTSRLLNAVKQFGKPKGAIVGNDKGTIRVVAGANPIAKITTRLPGGTLSLSGHIEVRANGTILIPVVGGTGTFAGARGELLITPLKEKNRALNEYRITLFGAI